ncbi:hypothetical protein UVI_02052020 [Ustilaginoidea virens]|nr:hypothetical protein UVI_02052020 [Ustilaginoidea virens]
MRLLLALVALFSHLAAAAPAVASAGRPGPGFAALQARQFGFGIGLGESNDLLQGSASECPLAIFIFARGTTEPGNLGSLGPLIVNTLRRRLGASKVWAQGVGGAYRAGFPENAMPLGTSPAAINEMKRLLALAHSKCPRAQIVAGGYSQGSALAAAAVGQVRRSIRRTIAGVVLFGYTKNQQNRGRIPNFPPSRTKVYCNTGDMVCMGTLFIMPAHLQYQGIASGPAGEWLLSKLHIDQGGD